MSAEPLVNGLLEAEDIRSDANAFGENEDNTGGSILTEDVLPVYTIVAPDGMSREICSNSQFDRDGSVLFADGNKLAEHRFLRMNIQAAGQYHFEIITNNTNLPTDDPDDDRDQSDPDIEIFLRGGRINQLIDCDADGAVDQFEGLCPTANREVFTTSNPLEPGEYVMALTEFRYHDEETPADYPARTCFDVTITPAP